MTTLATNVAWGTGPIIYFDFAYESKREGGIQFYRLQISCRALTGTNYYGYPIYLETSLDGTVADTHTLKTASPNQWETALTYTTDWLAVSRTSGTAALVIRIYSGSGSARNIRYSYALPTNATVSTVTATDAYIGRTSTIIINRASSALRHTLAYMIDGESDFTTIIALTDQNTVGWTVPTSAYKLNTDAYTIDATILCYTYDGDELIGSSTCRLTLRCNPSLCAPVVSLTAKDVRAETLALTGNGNRIVAGESTLKADVTASAREGTTLTIISYDFGDYRASFSPSTLSLSRAAATVAACTVKVTDARGLSTEKSATDLTLVSYIKPTIRVTAKRSSSTANAVQLTVSGKCWRGNFGAAQNTLTLRVRAKGSGSTSTDWVTLTPTVSGTSFTASGTINGCDYSQAYTIEAEATDALNTATGTAAIMRGISLFDWGEKDFRFNVLLRAIAGMELLAGKHIDITDSNGSLRAKICTSDGVQIVAYDQAGTPVSYIAVNDTGGISIYGDVEIGGNLNVTGTVNGA